ncbi:MAG: class I SAM-dependent methyltransferase [Bdellovibrionales bacterium]|nr:class I SAM-dependent methyltransferase [Bdellovibrionales bacterium]
MSEPKTFWENKILRWEKSRYSDWQRYYPPAWPIRRRLEASIQAIHHGLPRGSRVLELGCGSGYLAEALWGYCGHYQGVDIAEGAIAVARQRVPACEFEFFAGDAVNFISQPCDLTVFLGLTDWLTPLELRALFRRVTSKHILFSYTDVALWSPYRLYRAVMDKPTNRDSYRGRNYSATQIQDLLDENGFASHHVLQPTLFNPGALVWATAITHD